MRIKLRGSMLSILIIVTISIFAIVFLYLKSLETESFYCEGNIKKRGGEYNSNGTIRFEFNKKMGVVVYNGIVFNQNEYDDFSYKVYFSFTKENNFYILRSKGVISKVAGDDDLLLKSQVKKLPLFYTTKDEDYTIGIYKVSDNGFLIYNVFVPFLYCARR